MGEKDLASQLLIHMAAIEQTKPNLYLPTNLYQTPGDIPKVRGDRNRILWGFRDAGATAAGLPVIKALQQEGVDVFVLADGPARDILEKDSLLKGEDVGLRRSDLGWKTVGLGQDLNVAGHAVKPDIEQLLAYQAKDLYLPSIWYEDAPPFLGFYKRGLAVQRRLFVPDRVFCFSKTSAEQEIGYVPQFKGKTVVTGNPAFDRFASIDTAGIYKDVRNKLGVLDDETWFVYMATKTNATLETCRDLAGAVQGLGLEKYRFTARIHPAEAKDPAIKREYDQILGQLGEHALDTTGFSTDEVGIAADLVAGDTSTAMFEATLNDKPTMTILIPENMVLRDEWKDEFPPDPSIVLDGTSPVVRRKEDLLGVLHQVLFVPATQEDLRQKRQVWRSVVGGATERFRDRLMEIV